MTTVTTFFGPNMYRPRTWIAGREVVLQPTPSIRFENGVLQQWFEASVVDSDCIHHAGEWHTVEGQN